MVLDSQDTRLLHKLLRQGMSAVAILPEREVAAGTLESFPMRRLDVPGLDLAPVLIWLEHAYLSRTARRVIQCLHKVNADRSTLAATPCHHPAKARYGKMP